MNRIGYLDALKGLIMSLVVLGHVAYFNLGVNVSSDGNLHFYFHRFLMPLFFFVSGFLAYKKNFIWSMTNIKGFLSKKVCAQVISPFIFFCCFIQFRDLPLSEFATPMKRGYWFTFALFNFFVLYAFLRKLLSFIKMKEEKALITLLIIGFMLYFSPIFALLKRAGISEEILHIFSITHLNYFFFFVLGIYIKKHFEKFENILDGLLMAFAVILFFVIVFFVDMDLLYHKVRNLFLAISGIIIVFGLFRKNDNYFSGNSKIANIFQFLGKRTLDIYFIHYFFLSYNLPNILPFFSNHQLPMIEIALSLFMGIIVISASLVISFILRLNTTIAYYLFGEKKQ